MNRISVKYTTAAGADAIRQLEKKYKLKRESSIPVLRIYGYEGGAGQLAALEQEALVEYAEKQQSMELSE